MNPFETLIPKKQLSQGNPFAKLLETPPEPETKPQSVKGGLLGEIFTGNTQRFGKTIGEARAVKENTDRYIQALEQHDEVRNNLMKALRAKKQTGKDTTILEKALQNFENDIPKLQDFTGDVINKTKGQIAGEALGTGIEATGVGALKGFKGIGLVRNVAKTAEEANKAQKAYQGLSFGQKALSIGKDTAKMAGATLPFGYAYDVSAGLQGQRGKEREGAGAFKPGMATVVSGAIPAGVGALRFGRLLSSKVLPHVLSNLSGEPLEAYTRRQTGQLEPLIKGASKEKSLNVARDAVTKFRVGMIEEFGNSIEGITQKYSGARIGFDDVNAKKLGEVAEAFGFDMPQNVKSMSGKEVAETLTNLSEAYIPNASTLADVRMNNTVEALSNYLKDKGIAVFGGKEGEFAKMYQTYATKSNMYKEIAGVVGKVGQRATNQTNAARNRLSNIFSENSSAYLDAVKKFEQETGAKILDQVAAQRLNPYLPKTLRGAPTGVIGWASDLISLLSIPLSSPRVGSNIIRIISGMDEPMLTKLLDKVPGARNAIYKAVTKENMSFNDAVRKYAKSPQLGLSIEDVSKKFMPEIKTFFKNEPTFNELGQLKEYVNYFDSKQLPAGFTADKFKKQIRDLLAKRGVKNAYDMTDVSLAQFADNALTKANEVPRYIQGADGKFLGSQKSQQIKATAGMTTQMTNNMAKKTSITPKSSTLSADIPAIYKGEKDLTTKILKDLEGKTTVSKQYILDATNRGELKQVERDLVREALKNEGDTINVSDFAKKVKAELLPLKTQELITDKNFRHGIGADGLPKQTPIYTPRYENIALPDELRGKVKNYKENIYQSPIQTSAGNTHFEGPASKNYFGHTRIEDMADNKTRRVIEVQSDLYQKGNLEKEGRQAKEIISKKDEYSLGGRNHQSPETRAFINKEAEQRLKDVSKLEQYNDPTAHFRMIREEIKKAAQDGKTKLQFPTGETAMRIEQLGTQDVFTVRSGGRSVADLKPENMKVGLHVRQGTGGNDFIITDVLGDGKFKAVPKERLREIIREHGFAVEGSIGQKTVQYAKDTVPGFTNQLETFDISGKVDTNNPIYKFYEKDVQQYLKKFGGTKVKDNKGVEWIEVPIKKEWGKMPIEAFSVFPFLTINDNNK